MLILMLEPKNFYPRGTIYVVTLRLTFENPFVVFLSAPFTQVSTQMCLPCADEYFFGETIKRQDFNEDNGFPLREVSSNRSYLPSC